ncbi:ribosomal protein L15 [Pirellula staleyi DSM 6068]|uniref:Large ribosomal subunit protein uL15 n=1 Tax=Pirellula staleyi (strain ATCC 27377 / DSM 6068 / ICPB 4128) TaxID=530564 RepID=D2R6I8_PIRSD|nr:50S ribosomal protein L15 [Pirellula staleyi]ADB17288.1 ribosomal protein L15 [Pirellula staleyi DSM 6068]
MSLHEINVGIEKHKHTNRRGRGTGSGNGKTAGKGHKGQRARAGWKSLPIFQGGGSPLVRRVPKRGFTNSFAQKVMIINVGDLEAMFEDGTTVTPELLAENRIISGQYDVLKVLGDGDLTKKFTISAHRFSESAKEKIEKLGGTANVLPGKVTVAEKRAAAEAAKPPKKK